MTDLHDRVRVRGAREHNLQNVDVEVPRDALVAFTGVSGSGKSSLAFGTLFAESQRRYLESVAPYARRLIDQAGIPDVDSIEGMPPAVALRQQRGSASTRSSVGSVTTLSSLIRMLYSRAGNYPSDQPMLYAEDFSPNTPQGACPTCHGMGRVYEVTEALMVPDPTLTIRERAIASWPPAWYGQNLRDILVSLGYDVDVPWAKLPRKDRDWILFTEDRPTVPVYAGLTPAQTRHAIEDDWEPSYQGTFIGARRYVLDTFATTKSAGVKKRVSQFVGSGPCPACHGKRLKPEALSVTFEGLDIAALSRLTLDQLAALCATVLSPQWAPDVSGEALDVRARTLAVEARVAAGGAAHTAAPDVRQTPNMSPEKRAAAQRLVSDLQERLQPLIDLGLGYLSLARSTPTLSGGELQRVRLATQLSSRLFGVVYVLDEPSAGLHPRDREALRGILQGLKRSGNSVFVVEHSLDVIAAADWLVDIGPGAGMDGGQILYSGPPPGLADVAESVTQRYLFGEDTQRIARTPRDRDDWLELAGVRRNNLHDISVAIPLRCLTAVTGVSGSGKSSLVAHALAEIVGDRLGRPVRFDDSGDDDLLAEAAPAASGEVVGDTHGIRRVVCIDQKPIGRTPRSNVATYTGVFDDIRRRFSQTPEAQAHGYKPGRFSFNVAGGRCPTCEGEGWVMVELLFLPSVYSPCPDCHGTRYNADTLAIRWRGRNIAEVLELSTSAAREFFDGEVDILRALDALCDVGLGYLRLGQPATELSGGEAQRVKLAGELQRAHRSDALYLLDEPTAGLHPADTDRLLAHLHRLVDAGNTVVAAELDMRVVAQADYVIDLGPGAGAAGGHIVVAGTPAEVAQCPDSATGPYLAVELAR
ncbi:excinuclease ABC subunit A [Mycolicibacterium insubricum]|uniref:UvrABC system protein A n=1 Tax=Mycolicibacterium insubricum TaxID=444597 RepID=A0A1X0D3F5_9MYCO|nr:excinuclease ABC subunit UvrA [Mycolicibacterium insubricum]MCV7080660.1 excinuclease ABC subunit UvrA [Mycolicibacterium insubricum]ORA66875.1 excinuclease ABC subunit A [Mycolicibacterium insubricum]BBZ64990.1 excinuclease ABC subunit A [Mycolicibacterium insubricum]